MSYKKAQQKINADYAAECDKRENIITECYNTFHELDWNESLPEMIAARKLSDDTKELCGTMLVNPYNRITKAEAKRIAKKAKKLKQPFIIKTQAETVAVMDYLKTMGCYASIVNYCYRDEAVSVCCKSVKI